MTAVSLVRIDHDVYGVTLVTQQATFFGFVVKFGPGLIWYFDETFGAEDS